MKPDMFVHISFFLAAPLLQLYLLMYLFLSLAPPLYCVISLSLSLSFSIARSLRHRALNISFSLSTSLSLSPSLSPSLTLSLTLSLFLSLSRSLSLSFLQRRGGKVDVEVHFGAPNLTLSFTHPPSSLSSFARPSAPILIHPPILTHSPSHHPMFINTMQLL